MRDQSGRGTDHVAEGFASHRALTRDDSPEFGTQSMFSYLRAALEGNETEEESGSS